MNNLKTPSISFTGYDAIRLKGLYMQGTHKRNERCVLKEIRSVLQKEGLDLFVNTTNKSISNGRYEADETLIDKALSIWGQDRKAFVVNSKGKQVLWNTREPIMRQEDLGGLSDFQIHASKYMPRGGDYYLGFNKENEKWLLVNEYMIYDKNTFEKYADHPTNRILRELFDIKPKNMYQVGVMGEDLDEVVRPIGYPYILVNDYNKSLTLLDKMHEAFPKNSSLYSQMRSYIIGKLAEPSVKKADTLCEELRNFGFKPITIGGRYYAGINYINAIAFKNNKGKISYISNSTRKTLPELKFLEQLFDTELKKSVPEISDTYYICGGSRTPEEILMGARTFFLFDFGLDPQNVVMEILANRHGGVHCMCAEIPKF